MTAALPPATHGISRVSVLFFLCLSWTGLLEEHQIHPPPPEGKWKEKLFSPRAERGRFSLADGWHQPQPGHENSERKLALCVGNQDRGKLLANSFQQSICSVLVEILYTPCSCSDVLSQSSAAALLTQQVQTPQAPSSRRASLSNLCCLLLFQLSGSSRNSLPAQLCRLGFCTWLTPRTSIAALSREESSGKRLFPVNTSLKGTCIFELHTS